MAATLRTLASALLVSALFLASPAPARAQRSFDIAYLADLDIWNTVGIGVGSLGVVINTGTEPLDLSQFAIVSVSDDHPEAQVTAYIQHSSQTMLNPGEAAGALSSSAHGFIVGSGLVTEPIVDGNAPYINIGVSGLPLGSAGTVTGTIVFAIGDQLATATWTVKFVNPCPSTCGSDAVARRISSVAAEPNTGPGTDVTVDATVVTSWTDQTTVFIQFDSVESGGYTSVATSQEGDLPPSGFRLAQEPVYYEITTTSSFSGSVRVCLSWAEGQIVNETEVRIFHGENGQWVDITDPESLDTLNNAVCGVASGFSPFTLFEKLFDFVGFLPPIENAPVVNVVRAGAAVPIKFSLGGDKGLNILAPGYPLAALVQCQTGAPLEYIDEADSAGSKGLRYDANSDQYTFVWDTDRAWLGSCRELQLRFTDGQTYRARFTMGR